jgi:hypothetical protein
VQCSREFFARYVVHGKVVHVGLDEFESLILDHLDSLGIETLAKFSNLLSVETLTMLSHFEGLGNEMLNIFKTLNSLTHA